MVTSRPIFDFPGQLARWFVLAFECECISFWNCVVASDKLPACTGLYTAPGDKVPFCCEAVVVRQAAPACGNSGTCTRTRYTEKSTVPCECVFRNLHRAVFPERRPPGHASLRPEANAPQSRSFGPRAPASSSCPEIRVLLRRISRSSCRGAHRSLSARRSLTSGRASFNMIRPITRFPIRRSQSVPAPMSSIFSRFAPRGRCSQIEATGGGCEGFSGSPAHDWGTRTVPALSSNSLKEFAAAGLQNIKFREQ